MFSAFAPTTDIAGSHRTVTMCPQADIRPSIRSKSSPAPEFFFAKTRCTERLPPSGAETVFGQVFGRGGMTRSQNGKSPLPQGYRIWKSCAHTSPCGMDRIGEATQSFRIGFGFVLGSIGWPCVDSAQGLPSIRASTTRAKPYAIALPPTAGLSHMEKLRPYFTLRDGSDRRGN